MPFFLNTRELNKVPLEFVPTGNTTLYAQYETDATEDKPTDKEDGTFIDWIVKTFNSYKAFSAKLGFKSELGQIVGAIVLMIITIILIVLAVKLLLKFVIRIIINLFKKIS